MECQDVESHEVPTQEIQSLVAEGSPQVEECQNPWPHLSEYFSHVSSDNDKYIFSCRLCLPKRVLAKAHRTTISNLKQHIRRTHPDELNHFQDRLSQRSSNARNRKRISSGSGNYVPASSPLLPSSVKVETTTSPQRDQVPYPWPHLDDYFMFISRDGDRFVFNCKMCLPKNVLINGHRTSLNNLKQHINRTHPTYFLPFLEKVREGSCRGKCKRRSSADTSNGTEAKDNRNNYTSTNDACKELSINTIESALNPLPQTTPTDGVSIEANTTVVGTDSPVTSPPLQDQSENPWPRLSEYFLLNSRAGDKYIFNCKICMPKTSLIKAHRSTLSNLKQHIRRTHPADFKEFLSKIKRGRKHKPKKKLYSDCSSEASTPDSFTSTPSAKPHHHHHSSSKPCGSDVSQSLVEQRIVDFFVSNLLPHSAVESETFERLIRTLNPTKHSISRRTLGRRISNRQHDSLKEHLINIVLPTVRWVSVAVDCCYAHKKGYLGMTVHWLEPSNRKMQSAVLACIHFTGQQGREELSNAMVAVLREFGIEEKVTRTTIGENFIKSHFSTQTNLGVQVDAQPNVQSRGVDASVTALLSGCVDEHHLQYITLSNPLAATDSGLNVAHLNLQPHMPTHNSNHLNYASSNANHFIYSNSNCHQNHITTFSNPHSSQPQLICLNPPHIQSTNHTNQHTNNHTLPTFSTTASKHITCAAHILNTVASEDADNALQFNGAYLNSLSRARALWSQQDSSLVAADSILAEVGVRLVVPDSIRWSSTYDSVVSLNGVLEGKRPALYRVMLQLKLSAFDDQDVYFLKEYAMVMTPVAKALEKLQREDQAYLGTLLPTVAATIFRLNDLKTQGLVYCASLVDALLIGIYKRFEGLLEDEECQLAAAFHPRFRLIWLEKFNNTKVAYVRKLMEERVDEVMRQSSKHLPTSITHHNEDDDFFSVVTHPQESNNAHSLVKTWLETSSNDLLSDAVFLGEQALVDCFIRYNTAVPSCASVDRLFSKGTDLFQKKSSLSDDKFDMLIFMKGNMHLMERVENGKKCRKGNDV